MTDIATLKIEVDCSQVEKATAAVNELRAAVERFNEATGRSRSELEAMVNQATREFVIQQKRPGGLLAP